MLENFKRILVTTDFSEAGDHAITHTFRLAADHAAEIIMCHVIETVVAPNPLYAYYYPTEVFSVEVRDRAEQDAHRALLERVPTGPSFQRVPFTTEVAHGSPAEEIIRLARERDVDLIVIATHGRTGLQHLFLGSVAERVIRHVHCPVLVVR